MTDENPNFIKEWREHRGLTRAQLAQMTGASVDDLAKAEASDSPPAALLEKIGLALRCDPSELMTRDISSDMWTIYDQIGGARVADVAQDIASTHARVTVSLDWLDWYRGGMRGPEPSGGPAE